MKYKLHYEVYPHEYSKVVYGDTDSCMIELRTKSYKLFNDLKEKYRDVVKLTEEEKNNLQEIKYKIIEESFECGTALADEVTKELFKKPIKLEFEKVYQPFIILSKKRYLGNYYGTNPRKIDFVEKKGIVLKRRDNPEIVKKVYNGIIEPILLDGSRGINTSIEFLKTQLYNLTNNNVDYLDLVITKTLAKGYGKVCKKCEGNGCGFCEEGLVISNNDYKNFNIPHVALAIKMRKRDPGSAPSVNDRINYVFVDDEENPDGKLYERVEHLDTVIDKKMKIDFLYYIENQIHNPVVEILKLLLEEKQIKELFDHYTKEYKDRRKMLIKVVKDRRKLPKGQTTLLKWLGTNNS